MSVTTRFIQNQETPICSILHFFSFEFLIQFYNPVAVVQNNFSYSSC